MCNFLARAAKKMYCGDKQRKMIKPLRKYHFFTWRILAVLLPVMFVAAILLRPNSFVNYQPMEDDFSFSLKKLTDSTAQVSINVKNALKVPSCLIYASLSSKDILLGKIDHHGLYNFEVKTQVAKAISIRLYDAIHKREIAHVQLTDNSK